MGEAWVGLPADSTGKKLRTRQRVIGADTIQEQYVLRAMERVPTFVGTATTFRMPGNAAALQNLFSIENGASSTVLVAIRELQIINASSAATTTLDPVFSLSRITTLPTGGTAMVKSAVDTSYAASNASVVVRGAASADGTASAITATAGTAIWRRFGSRLHTAAGQTITERWRMGPTEMDEYPYILRAGQGYLVQLTTLVAADNIAGRHFMLSVAWEEFTLP